MTNLQDLARNLLYGEKSQDSLKNVVNMLEQILANRDVQIGGQFIKNAATNYLPGGQQASTLYSKDSTPQEKQEALRQLSNPMEAIGRYGLDIGKAILTAPVRLGETAGRTYGEALGNLIWKDQYEPNRKSIFGGQSIQQQREQLAQMGASDTLGRVIPTAQYAMDMLLTKKATPQLLQSTYDMAKNVVGDYKPQNRQGFINYSEDFIPKRSTSGGVGIDPNNVLDNLNNWLDDFKENPNSQWGKEAQIRIPKAVKWLKENGYEEYIPKDLPKNFSVSTTKPLETRIEKDAFFKKYVEEQRRTGKWSKNYEPKYLYGDTRFAKAFPDAKSPITKTQPKIIGKLETNIQSPVTKLNNMGYETLASSFGGKGTNVPDISYITISKKNLTQDVINKINESGLAEVHGFYGPIRSNFIMTKKGDFGAAVDNENIANIVINRSKLTNSEVTIRWKKILDILNLAQSTKGVVKSSK